MGATLDFSQGTAPVFFGIGPNPSPSPVGPNGVAALIVNFPRSLTSFTIGADAPMTAMLTVSLLVSTDNGATYNPIIMGNLPIGQRLTSVAFGPAALIAFDRLAIMVIPNAMIPTPVNLSITLS